MISPKVQTRRQRVLELITEGLSIPKIADECGVSEPTARFDVRVLIVEHGADNITHLAALAVRRKLVK